MRLNEKERLTDVDLSHEQRQHLDEFLQRQAHLDTWGGVRDHHVDHFSARIEKQLIVENQLSDGIGAKPESALGHISTDTESTLPKFHDSLLDDHDQGKPIEFQPQSQFVTPAPVNESPPLIQVGESSMQIRSNSSRDKVSSFSPDFDQSIVAAIDSVRSTIESVNRAGDKVQN